MPKATIIIKINVEAMFIKRERKTIICSCRILLKTRLKNLKI